MATAGKVNGMKRSSLKRARFIQFFDNLKENDRLIRDSNVLSNKDPNMWDWDIVITIFRSDSLGSKLDDQNTRFIKRIIDYFKPSNNRFSHQDLTGNSRQLPAYVTAALELLDWLQQSQEVGPELRWVCENESKGPFFLNSSNAFAS